MILAHLAGKYNEIILKKYYLLICISLLCSVLHAQTPGLFRGRVVDAADGNPLPLCHLQNQNNQQVTYTDISGYFNLKAEKGDRILVSYVGYDAVTLTYQADRDMTEIKLLMSSNLLEAAVVRPGKNPAHRIIENAIRNRNQNHPEKNRSYRCMQYNKMVFSVVPDSLRTRSIHIKAPFLTPDTVNYNLIMESVMERKFMPPGNLEEKVVASRTSGFEAYQQLSMIPSTLQFFHFYDDVLEWRGLNQSYLNPISPGSTERYFFQLKDTLISGADSTFVIDFRPSRRSSIEGLKGTLYINSDGWAIQNVIAEPATAALFPIRMQQQYRKTGPHWFPHELSFEAYYQNFAMMGIDLVYYSKSVMNEVELNADFSGDKFVANQLLIAEDAGKQGAMIDTYRSIPLTQKELNTYQKYEGKNYDWGFQLAEGMVDNQSLSVGIFDLPFLQLVNHNYYEGWQFGIGLYTNRWLSPYFSVGGYFRHGLKDKENKYGVSVSIFPNRDMDTEFRLWAQKDLSNLSISRELGLSGAAWLGNFYLSGQYKLQELQPIFEYSFQNQSFENAWLHNSELGVQLRYTIQERRSKVFRRTYASFTDYPVFYLRYAMGIPSVFESAYHYQKVELGVQFSHFIRNFGRTRISLWGGVVSNHTPMMMLFTQSYIGRSIFLTEETKSRFNVIADQTYAANQYVNAFLYHDFGTLLHRIKSKVFRPRIAIAQSAGWSWLSHIQDHGGEPLSDMRQGYFESGLVIEDLLRVNLLNVCFLGFGCGVYGAYGGSVDVPFEQTLTPMIRFSASF